MSDKNKKLNNEIAKKETLNKEEFGIIIKGVDIDKNEYQEIVLSNSNCPEKDFYKSYYD